MHWLFAIFTSVLLMLNLAYGTQFNIDETQTLIHLPTTNTATTSQSTQQAYYQGPLLQFTATSSSVRAQGKTTIQWRYSDDTLLTTFPTSQTFVSLNLVSNTGEVIGTINDAVPVSSTSTEWDVEAAITKKLYNLKAKTFYKIQATLYYAEQEPVCKASTGSCNVSEIQRISELKKRAALYLASESSPFTLDMSSYITPILTVDPNSLTIYPGNMSIRGTSNLSELVINISKGNAASPLVKTTISVIDGSWSYTPPTIADGYYTLSLQDSHGLTSFPGQTLHVSSVDISVTKYSTEDKPFKENPYLPMDPSSGTTSWSCAEGTEPNGAVSECTCISGYKEVSKDNLGRRICQPI